MLQVDFSLGNLLVGKTSVSLVASGYTRECMPIDVKVEFQLPDKFH